MIGVLTVHVTGSIMAVCSDGVTGSIMAVSNTGGHGRGGQEGNIIGTFFHPRNWPPDSFIAGDVINHGKKQFWGKRNVHYHQG